MNKIIILYLLAIVSNRTIAQTFNFATTSFNAEIKTGDIPKCEVSSVLDFNHNTHIAWIKTIGTNQYLMYSLYNNTNVTTTQISTTSITERKSAPSIILDANSKPHIVYFIKRDPTLSGQPSGNYAIMYAGDADGDGTFEVSQVSTNSTTPSDNTDNIFNCYVNGRPNISLEGNTILVSYIADPSSLNAYNPFIIFARKNGSTWNKTQEYDISSYGVTEPLTSSDITLPMILTPDLPNVWLDLSNYNPRYNTKSGGVWTNTAISQYSGFGNISNPQIEAEGNAANFFMWFSRDSSIFYYKEITSSSIGAVRQFQIPNKKTTTSNFRPATIDLTNGRPLMSYADNSGRIYIMWEDNGVINEQLIPSVGTYFGKRCLNFNNDFISLVTADESTGKIFITTNTGNPTGINDLPNDNLEIQFYPNPALNILNVYASTPSTISIFDSNGKEVMKNDIKTNTKIDVSTLSKGLYIAKSKNGTTQKFIKE